MSTIDPRVAHSPLSRRAKFDLATLITTGVASAALFLLPLSSSIYRSMTSAVPEVSQLATGPAVESTYATASALATIGSQVSVPHARPRAAIRQVRATRATPEFVQAKVEAKRPQSRLSRFLLGDGSESVQPFPLADRRLER